MQLSIENIRATDGFVQRYPVTEKTIRETVNAFYESSDFRSAKRPTRVQKRYELEKFCAMPWQFGGTYGDLPMTHLTYEIIDAIIVQRLDRPGACRALIWSLRALSTFAAKIGIPIGDPTIDIVLPSLSPHGWRTWTEAEIAIFEANYPIGTKERLVFALALYTALRRGDLCVVGPPHVRNGVIYICPEKTRMTTGAFVVLPVHPELAKVLSLLPPGQEAFLLTSRGRPFSFSWLGAWFSRTCREAGLPKGLSLHGLRKAACRRLAESGCTVHEIMAVSGHRSMRQAEHYTMNVSWEKLARSAMGNLVHAFPSSADTVLEAAA